MFLSNQPVHMMSWETVNAFSINLPNLIIKFYFIFFFYTKTNQLHIAFREPIKTKQVRVNSLPHRSRKSWISASSTTPLCMCCDGGNWRRKVSVASWVDKRQKNDLVAPYWGTKRQTVYTSLGWWISDRERPAPYSVALLLSLCD